MVFDGIRQEALQISGLAPPAVAALHCRAQGSGRPPTAGSAVTGEAAPQACCASATRLPAATGTHAFTSFWGVPCHYYFQSKLATCRTPLSQATFHQTIPTRHSEGTSLVSETAPNSTAPLWQRHRAPGSAGAASAGAPPREASGPSGSLDRSRCHRAEAGALCNARPSTAFAKELKASVWVWSFKWACHTCHHSALFKCRETAGNQTHLYYIHTSERGIKIINCLEIDKWCETVE